MIDKKEKTLAVNWDDELVKGTFVAKDGQHRASESRDEDGMRSHAMRLTTPLVAALAVFFFSRTSSAFAAEGGG